LKQLVFLTALRRPLLGLATCADGGGIIGLKGTLTMDEGFTG